MKICKKLHEYEGKRCPVYKKDWESNNRDRINISRKLNPNTSVSKREWQKGNKLA